MSLRIAFVMFSVPNPRLIKRIKAASECGEVIVIYQVSNENPYIIDQQILNNFNTIKFNSNSKDDNTFSTLISFLVLVKKYLKVLKKFNPDIIHASNLLGTSIACLYRFIHNKKVQIIEEVGDINKYLIDSTKGINKLFQKFLRFLDGYMLKRCSLLIVTSEAFYENYYINFISKDKVLYLPNEPELSVFDNFKKKDGGVFTVGFIGSVRYQKQLEMLFEVAKHCKIRVFVAGEGISYPYLLEKYKNIPYIEFYGKYDYEKEVKNLYERVDCVYSVYDTQKGNVCIALPNRLYESVTCKLPLLVAKNTRLAELTEEWGVGISVSDNDINDLQTAINLLKNDYELRREIEVNCENAKVNFVFEKNNRIYKKLLKERLL